MRTLRTVTLNTGFDDTYVVSDVPWGGVGRVHRFASQPSGKGVNAARSAAALGLRVRAYALVGRAELTAFRDGLEREGIDHRLVAVEGSTRHNLTLMPHSGEQIAAHLVGEGFHLDDAEPVEELFAAVIGDCQPGDLVSCNGSVPAGLPSAVWSELAHRVRRAGADVALDLQGEAMRLALSSGPAALAKPNESEVEALLPQGAEGGSAAGVAQALRALADHGVRLPVVTLGSRGAAFLQGGRAVRAMCPVDAPRVAVGAGDAFLAGACRALLHGGGGDLEAVRSGLAAAAAHVSGTAGRQFAEAFHDNLRRVRVTDAAIPWGIGDGRVTG